jgi:hypothetical protein
MKEFGEPEHVVTKMNVASSRRRFVKAPTKLEPHPVNNIHLTGEFY